MDAFERYDQFKDTRLDVVLSNIFSGSVVCGRYANKIKVGKPPKKIDGVLFDDVTPDKKRKDDE